MDHLRVFLSIIQKAGHEFEDEMLSDSENDFNFSPYINKSRSTFSDNCNEGISKDFYLENNQSCGSFNIEGNPHPNNCILISPSITRWLENIYELLEHFSVKEHLHFINCFVEETYHYLNTTEIPLMWNFMNNEDTFTPRASKSINYEQSSKFFISITRFYYVFSNILETLDSLFMSPDISSLDRLGECDRFTLLWNERKKHIVNGFISRSFVSIDVSKPHKLKSFFFCYIAKEFQNYIRISISEIRDSLIARESINPDIFEHFSTSKFNIFNTFFLKLRNYFLSELRNSWMFKSCGILSLIPPPAFSPDDHQIPFSLFDEFKGEFQDFGDYPQFPKLFSISEDKLLEHSSNKTINLGPPIMQNVSVLLDLDPSTLIHRQNTNDFSPETKFKKNIYSFDEIDSNLTVESPPVHPLGSHGPTLLSSMTPSSHFNPSDLWNSKSRMHLFDYYTRETMNQSIKFNRKKLGHFLRLVYGNTTHPSNLSRASTKVPPPFDHLPIIGDILSLLGLNTSWQESLKLCFTKLFFYLIDHHCQVETFRFNLYSIYSILSIFAFPFLRLCFGLGDALHLDESIPEFGHSHLTFSSYSYYNDFYLVKLCKSYNLLQPSSMEKEYDQLIGTLFLSILDHLTLSGTNQLSDVMFFTPNYYSTLHDLNNCIEFINSSSSLNYIIPLSRRDTLTKISNKLLDSFRTSNDTTTTTDHLLFFLRTIQLLGKSKAKFPTVDSLLKSFKQLVPKTEDIFFFIIEKLDEIRKLENSFSQNHVNLFLDHITINKITGTEAEIKAKDSELPSFLLKNDNNTNKESLRQNQGTLIAYLLSLTDQSQSFSKFYENYLATMYLKMSWNLSSSKILSNIEENNVENYIFDIGSSSKLLKKEMKNIDFLKVWLDSDRHSNIEIMTNDMLKNIMIFAYQWKHKGYITAVPNLIASLCICSSGYWPESLISTSTSESEAFPFKHIHPLLDSINLDLIRFYSTQESGQTIEFIYSQSFIELDISGKSTTLPFIEASIFLDLNDMVISQRNIEAISLWTFSMRLGCSIEYLETFTDSLVKKDIFHIIKTSNNAPSIIPRYLYTNAHEQHINNDILFQDFSTNSPKNHQNNSNEMPPSATFNSIPEIDNQTLSKAESKSRLLIPDIYKENIEIYENDFNNFNLKDSPLEKNSSEVIHSGAQNFSDDLKASNYFSSDESSTESIDEIDAHTHLNGHETIILSIIQDRAESLDDSENKTQSKSTPTALILSRLNNFLSRSEMAPLKYHDLWKILCSMETRKYIKRNCGNWDLLN